MQKLVLYATTTLLLTALVQAADVSGKWTGTLEGQGPDGPISVPANMEFKQTGQTITGSVWKDTDHQFAIDKGKIDGSQITFEFTAPEGGDESSGFLHRVKLTLVAENKLEGELNFEVEGNKVAAKLKLAKTQ